MASHQPPGAERRNSPRTETDLFGSVQGGSNEFRCRIVNVSRIGACAVSPTAFPDMAQVRIRLRDDQVDGDDKDVRIEAAVVRCQRRSDGQFDLGLFFTGVNSKQMISLDRIISKAAPAPVV
jgi:hypothetical protein